MCVVNFGQSLFIFPSHFMSWTLFCFDVFKLNATNLNWADAFVAREKFLKITIINLSEFCCLWNNKMSICAVFYCWARKLNRSAQEQKKMSISTYSLNLFIWKKMAKVIILVRQTNIRYIKCSKVYALRE